MEMVKKSKWLIILPIVLFAGVFYIFYSLYQKDVKALEDFSASYHKFDNAISDFSVSEADDSGNKAGDALTELNTKAAALRLSSLIKNDAELMDKAHEVADFSGRELDNLRAYKRVLRSKNVDSDKFAKVYNDLKSERKTAYSLFRKLAELKD